MTASRAPSKQGAELGFLESLKSVFSLQKKDVSSGKEGDKSKAEAEI